MDDVQLQSLLSDRKGSNEVKLNGKIKISLKKDDKVYVGRQVVKGHIIFDRPNVTLDGTDAVLEVEAESVVNCDSCLFYIKPEAANVTIRNLNIKIDIENQKTASYLFAAIYNTAFGLKIENCRIQMQSTSRLNLVALYNNGNVDTHLATRADNLSVVGSTLEVKCLSDEMRNNEVYGIYNRLANSISINNTQIFICNQGIGAGNKAIGVYTNGRFGRYVGNNIKANCTHFQGKEKEHAHAYGLINEGLHNIFTSNNIVSEWAGKGIAFDNRGMYTEIVANKFLATHTINGTALLNTGEESLIEGNVIVSTSRNARLLVNYANYCILSRNILDVFMGKDECKSGCGIYIAESVRDNIVTENLIRNVLDCAILASQQCGVVDKNRVVECGTERSDFSNKYLTGKLDESRIQSLYN